MKNTTPIILAALLCLPVAAQAQESRYWSVQGGMNNVSDWPGRVNFGGPSVDASLQIDRGVQFGAAIGKQYHSARYELEYQHGQFDITGARVAAVAQAADASGKYDVLTANAYRVLPLNAAWSAYAGLGIGYGRVNLPQLGGAAGCQCLGKASKGSVAYQARLGMEYRVSDAGQAFVQAGWLSLPGAQSDGAAYVAYPRRGFATLGIGYRAAFN
ncbi:MAG: outer membrane beta-barrel protein [Massilia sp.]|nr:outer membrane beta-barrel protein [Massilia sp.]